jgi:hypothetical protein
MTVGVRLLLTPLSIAATFREFIRQFQLAPQPREDIVFGGRTTLLLHHQVRGSKENHAADPDQRER